VRLRGDSPEPDPALLQKAIETYGALLDADPENYLAQNNLGAAFLDRHDLDRAIEQLELAVKRKNGNSLMMKHLGIAYYRKSVKLERSPHEAVNSSELTEPFLSDVPVRGS
jgi:tetratricopeptide (TPR) repeat protein